MLEIRLDSFEETRRLARLLAGLLPRHPQLRAILLRGPLGSGKTTFACALANALPGGDAAETGSPSFTLCNRYPTTPTMMHADMYRCPDFPPDDLLEALQDPDTLTVLEWAEFLPVEELPEEFLDISFASCENTRLLTVTGSGRDAESLTREFGETAFGKLSEIRRQE
ncbi:MAG: tRNA (adenosine(37)-N6)-threonylcarbamoyltransferase complex ATPase subunit type 1 TsaE [Desulfovibrio sp.]|jgi:tRNA threonylcarbamoyladenosine biosynthesis protein TsaE|nr:tRNA (adenosine(37)-N6)-threonylcarbamoyltransferase complex ATPase subunit type 1 TsaE [Desulfovibrio sp.]